MFKLIKSIFAKTLHEQLPRLENTLTADYDPAFLSDDEYLILLAGVAKDPNEARRLMEEYHVSTAHELLQVLPKKKINWLRRWKRWTQSLEGSYNSDPFPDLLWPDGSGQNYLEKPTK